MKSIECRYIIGLGLAVFMSFSTAYADKGRPPASSFVAPTPIDNSLAARSTRIQRQYEQKLEDAQKIIQLMSSQPGVKASDVSENLAIRSLVLGNSAYLCNKIGDGRVDDTIIGNFIINFQLAYETLFPAANASVRISALTSGGEGAYVCAALEL